MKDSELVDVQGALDSSSGQIIYDVLNKFIEPSVVKLPMDHAGRIDPLKVMLYEGRRSVIAYIDTLILKDLSKVRQEKAEIK